MQPKIVYRKEFEDRNLDNNPDYPANEIGIAKLFYDLHSDRIAYVSEAQAYYVYDCDTGVWQKDINGRVHEYCKEFIKALITDDNSVQGGAESA